MKTYLVILLSIPSVGAMQAQYDIGISGGSYQAHFRDVHLEEKGYQWCAALFYRERVADHTDISFELQMTNRRLIGSWDLQGESQLLHVKATDLWLQHLYLTMLFDVRMVASGNVMLRFGPQVGVKMAESFSGIVTADPEDTSGDSVIDDLVNSRTDYFRNDQRFYAGIGFRLPLNTRFAIVLDPYFSTSLSRMLREPKLGMTNEFGLRLGFSRRFHGRGLKQRFIDGLHKKAPAEDIVP